MSYSKTHTYHFIDEGTDDVLKVVKLQSEMTDAQIDTTIEKLEDMFGCMVLWEEV